MNESRYISNRSASTMVQCVLSRVNPVAFLKLPKSATISEDLSSSRGVPTPPPKDPEPVDDDGSKSDDDGSKSDDTSSLPPGDEEWTCTTPPLLDEIATPQPASPTSSTSSFAGNFLQSILSPTGQDNSMSTSSIGIQTSQAPPVAAAAGGLRLCSFPAGAFLSQPMAFFHPAQFAVGPLLGLPQLFPTAPFQEHLRAPTHRTSSVSPPGISPRAQSGTFSFEDNPFAFATHSDAVRVAKRERQAARRRSIATFKCSKCPEKFVDDISLASHERSHVGRKLFACDFCSARFSTNSQRDRHHRTHSGREQFECHMCQKLFVDKESLETHNADHMESKPYQCKICFRCYTQQGALTTHMRTHTGERPFECSECYKGFKSSGVLKVHMRTHSDERPFECSECYKGFKSSGVLKVHMRTHSD
eukprot:190674_1